MARPHAAALAVLLGFAAAASCYSDRLPPPTFRYVCGNDLDCKEFERCMDGLCERPCSQATYETDCEPDVNGYAVCFNGVCSNVCELPAGLCAVGQECFDLGIDLSGDGGGGGGSTEDLMLGICGKMCDGTCPAGEMCLAGFCVATCDPMAQDSTCPFGLPCQDGLCIPDLGGTGSGSEGGTLATTLDSTGSDTATAGGSDVTGGTTDATTGAETAGTDSATGTGGT